MKRKLSFEFCLNGTEVKVEANYWPAYAGCWYRSNGDPGDPPEPSEAEITSITCDGKAIEFESLTEEQQKDLYNQALLEGDDWEPDEPPKDDEGY